MFDIVEMLRVGGTAAGIVAFLYALTVSVVALAAVFARTRPRRDAARATLRILMRREQ